MRRLTLSIIVSSAAIIAGCEDGPNQTFNPAPAGAGTVWNNSNSPGTTSDAGKDFTGAGTAGQNANVLCNPEKKKTVWANMLKQPFFPPAIAGNLDIAGGVDGAGTFVPDPTTNAQKETWTGLTLDQAEKINCQSTFAGDVYGDGSFYYAAWGDNEEVAVQYRVSNRQIYTILLLTGYLGELDATSRDGKHKFVIKVDGTPLQKDGAPFLLDWNSTDPIPGDATIPGHDNGKIGEQLNELYDAMAATYTALPAEPDCIASGHCIVDNFGDQGALFWYTPLGFTAYVQTTNAGPVVASTPVQINQDKKKLLGYSFADAMLQFDSAGTGPTGTALNVFGSGKDCKIRMDMPFSEFRDSCVAPMTDVSKQKVELAKLFGGFGHGDETYSFDVAGLDPNFSALQPQSLPDNDIVRDNDRPKDADPLTSLRIDQEAGGVIANDFKNNDVTQAQDWHGSGLVTLEWAKLVQDWFQNYNALNGGPATKVGLGDPKCLTAAPAAGCTGMEGVISSAPAASIDPATLAANPFIAHNALGAAAVAKYSKLNIGLKPAAWHSFFCTDPSKTSTCAGFGANDSFFQTAYNQLIKVAGGGVAGNLPTETQDVRFLFKQWIFALVKYLQVADNPAATLAMVDAAKIDENNLFFDAVGAGQFEIAEYIDRHNANKGQDPIDLNFTVDVLHGIFNDYTFSRHLRRGESLLYGATRETATDHLGFENTALLTNFAGSPVLAAAYPSYECATNTDPANAHCIPAGSKQAIVAPQDANGNFLTFDNGDLILKPYPGAWGQTPLTIGAQNSFMVDSTTPPPFIQSALVTVPIYENPYDPSSKALTPMTKLIPWFPKSASVGFSVPINGQQDKFIETYSADFSGITISANVDYDLYPNDGGAPTLKIRGIETTDFLGEVFPCQDPGTGDLLRVRMYTSAKTILEWFTAHPGASTSCGMIFRYSPYGNYLDFITSTTNGVRLSINPGAGGGRVVDAVLFDPTVIGQ